MKITNLHVVILAGGSGTRFWPMSRPHKPKQFLNIIGEQTLFQMTLERVRPLVARENIWVVTNQKFLSLIKAQCHHFPVEHNQILLEPSGKNTAPAIAWAASRIYQKNKDAIMVVLPSDHLIQNPEAFQKHLRQAVALAENHLLVTMGIVPTRPETGYGYLKIKATKNFLAVEKFTEKPDLSLAKKFVKSGQYYWNSGMFIWRVDAILSEFEKYLPVIYKLTPGFLSKRTFSKTWAAIPGISIDYGILEKSDRVAAVAAGDIGWSDVGSWEALSEILPKNKEGNVLKGNVLAFDSLNTMILGDKKLIATIGLENFVVIDTPDAILICPKDRSQHVRKCAEKANV